MHIRLTHRGRVVFTTLLILLFIGAGYGAIRGSHKSSSWAPSPSYYTPSQPASVNRTIAPQIHPAVSEARMAKAVESPGDDLPLPIPDRISEMRSPPPAAAPPTPFFYVYHPP